MTPTESLLIDKGITRANTCTASVLMVVARTMLTLPVIAPMLGKLRSMISKST